MAELYTGVRVRALVLLFPLLRYMRRYTTRTLVQQHEMSVAADYSEG